MSRSTSDAVDDANCFALLESPVHGNIIRSRPSAHLVKLVICDWISSGGPEVLHVIKLDSQSSADTEDHWITIPRSILKRYDTALPGVGQFKFVAMHLRVMAIVNKSLGVSEA